MIIFWNGIFLKYTFSCSLASVMYGVGQQVSPYWFINKSCCMPTELVFDRFDLTQEVSHSTHVLYFKLL